MTKCYFSKFLLLAAILLGLNVKVISQTTTFNVSGTTIQSYTVPGGVTSIGILCTGAQGGNSNYFTGGKAATMYGVFTVSPGQVLKVLVGAQPAQGSNAGGGGGGSFVWDNSSSTLLIAAGGGGGAGYSGSSAGNSASTSTTGVSGTGGYTNGGTSGNGGFIPSSTAGYSSWAASGAGWLASGNNGTGCGATSGQRPLAGGLGGNSGGSSVGAGGFGGGGGGDARCGIIGGGGGGGYSGGGCGADNGGSYQPGGGGGSYNAGAAQVNTITSATGNGVVAITALSPSISSSMPFMNFGTIPVGSLSVPQYTLITGLSLTPGSGTITVNTPSSDFLVSLTGAAGSYTSSLSFSYSGGGFGPLGLFVQFQPGSPIPYNSNITFSGGGLTLPATLNVYGNGSNTVCAGSPTVSGATVTPSSGSSGTFFTLTVPSVGASSGLTYQWQSAASLGGPWTDIPGALNITYSFTGITATTYYRCIVTCPSGTSTTSGIATAGFSSGVYKTPCAGTPNPGVLFTPLTTGCNPYTDFLFDIGATSDSGITHQWQSSPDGLAWTNVPGGSGVAIMQSITGSTYYRDVLTCLVSGSLSTTTTQLVSLFTPPAPISGASNICTANPVTFTSTTLSGTWSSSNIAVANVGSSSGLVTGNGAGTATISYTLSTGCNATMAVTVSTSPAPITGTPMVCTGLVNTLSDATAGGTWSTSDPSMATVTSGGAVTGVGIGLPYITYTLASGCMSTMNVTVNPQPAPIGGPGGVCAGSSITLTESVTGGVWASSNSFQASVSSGTGFVTGIIAGGSPTISYTLPGGCFVTKPMTVNALPAPITGSSNVCAGSTTNLTDGGGGTWSSLTTSIATIGAGSGVVTGVAAGTTTITYTLPVTGCRITQPMTVNLLPSIFSVTGGGGYCIGGSGRHVGLSGSTPGVDYKLYNGSALVTTVSGSSSGLDFGLMTATGTYTVQATDATYGCNNNMSGSTSITVNSLPNDYPMLTGSSVSYCAGASGVDIVISGSDGGVSYQLYLAGVPVGSGVPGTGAGPLDLGFHTATGTYSVIATDVSTLCTNTMTGTTTISINTPPVVYPISGSGTGYCAGGAGIDISMPSSDPVSYDLYKNGVIVPGSTLTGGGSIDFGYQTAVGTYTVKATDASTSCTSNMSGSVKVIINPLPALQTMTGGGAFCTGGAGVHVGLNYSATGTNYDLWLNGSLLSGTTKAGSNSGLDFGAQTAPGSYTVVATSALGCTATMTGSKTVSVNPLPNAYLVTGGGGYCAGSTGSLVNLQSSDGGVLYRLYRGGTSLITTVTGSGSGFSFGSFTTAGTYTVTGFDPVTGCGGNMTGSAIISINPLPNVYTVSATNGGKFCAGGTPDSIILSGSQVGVNYTYILGSIPQGSLAGTGGRLNFGAVTTPGAYTVVATDGVTSCTKNMAGVATITMNPLPAAYTVSVTGGGNYCAGGAGLHILLSGSNSGIDYQLYDATPAAVGLPLGGTGGGVDFGIHTAAGAYTVVATNVVTGCQMNMTGAGTINIIPLPTPYTLTGTGTNKYCPSGAGVDITLSGSVSGVNYNLYNAGSLVKTLGGSTGAGALDFSLNPLGVYTATAVDVTYGCVSNMTGSVTISNYTVPNAYVVTGGGSPCAVGPGVHVGLANSQYGVKYQLYNGSAVGSPVAGTTASLDFGLQTTAGSYTVIGTDTTTTCTSNMTGSASITPITPDVPSFTIAATKSAVCTGDTATITPKALFGGTTPVYTWMVNGATVPGGSTFTYVPSNNDTVTAIMLSSAACVIAGPVMSSDSVFMVVQSPVTPTVTISTPSDASSPKNMICKNAATSVPFTATSTNSGSAPIYQWKKNSISVGTNSTSYSTAIDDSDVIFCVLASNAACATAKFVYSLPIKMYVIDAVTPEFAILADPGTITDKGTSVTFTALVSNLAPGVTFTYQWFKNSVSIPGATSGTYVTSSYSDNDAISCVVTSHNTCGTATGTHAVFMTVSTTGVTNVSATRGSDVRVVPNPNKGTFSIKGSLGTTADEEVSLDITNMLGQTVYSNKVVAHDGNLNEQVVLKNSLANGMYLLNLRSATDHKVFHFVIEQ